MQKWTMPSPPELATPEAPHHAPTVRLRGVWWFAGWMVPGYLYLIGVLALLEHQGILSWCIGNLYEASVGPVFALALGSTVVLWFFDVALRWTGGLLVGCGLTCLWLPTSTETLQTNAMGVEMVSVLVGRTGVSGCSVAQPPSPWA